MEDEKLTAPRRAMTGADVARMFRLAAERPDPASPDGADLAGLKAAYEARLDRIWRDGGEEEAEPEKEPWQMALEYVGAVFEALDAADAPRPGGEERISARAKTWEIIANGVSNWYCRRPSRS